MIVPPAGGPLPDLGIKLKAVNIDFQFVESKRPPVPVPRLTAADDREDEWDECPRE